MADTAKSSLWPEPRAPKSLITFDYPFAHKRMKFDSDGLKSAIFFNLAGHPRRPEPEQLRNWLRNPEDADSTVVKNLFEGLPGNLLNTVLWNSGASIYEMARLFHTCNIDYWKTVVWVDQFSLDSTKPKGIPSYYE